MRSAPRPLRPVPQASAALGPPFRRPGATDSASFPIEPPGRAVVARFATGAPPWSAVPLTGGAGRRSATTRIPPMNRDRIRVLTASAATGLVAFALAAPAGHAAVTTFGSDLSKDAN